MARKQQQPRYPDTQGPSAHGGNLSAVRDGAGCSFWERAQCLEIRAETDPETLMTDIPVVLQCPACGLKINWGENNE